MNIMVNGNFGVCLCIMQKKINHPFMFIIYGPTGVGKTELALEVAKYIPAEIVNMDVGQFYTPLSIGTAKPDWRNSPIPHHLFDIIDTPTNYTINNYRSIAYEKIKEILARGKLPILVGGSGFYLRSLLFEQPTAIIENSAMPSEAFSEGCGKVGWQQLYDIDPVRAEAINKSDTYRIERALNIWHTTGKLPSSYAPLYNPEMDYSILFVNRDRQELRKRINARVDEMLESGWIDEAKNLINTPWQDFLIKKNLIGYSEIFDYLSLNNRNSDAFDHMVELISAQTRQYAKRQCTFWRKLEREIKKEKQYTGTNVGCLDVVNLTDTDINVYSKKLSFILNAVFHCY